MKKILLALVILSLATLSFAFLPKNFWVELQADGIMSYVDVLNPLHDPDFNLSVTDIVAEETISTTTHVANSVRVCQNGGPTGNVAWAFFNVSQYSQGGAVPVGRQFLMALTYVGVRDEPITLTKTITYTGGGALFLYGEDAWVLPPEFFGEEEPPITHTISGMFTTTNWDFTGITFTGIAPDKFTVNTTTGAYTVTVADGTNIDVIPAKDGYTFNPAQHTYTNVIADYTEIENFVILKGVDPEAPVIIAPTAGQQFPLGPVTVTWTAPAGFAPEYYEVNLNNATEWLDVGNVLTWDTPVLAVGEHTVQVRGVINTPQAKSYVPVLVSNSSRKATSNSRGAGLAASVTFEVLAPPELTITSDPVGAAVWLNGVALDPAVVTPYTTTVAGTYSLATMPGYEPFVPAEYIWDGAADHTENFVAEPIVVGPFDLTITSTPAGAHIFYNGVKIEQVTPYTVVAAAAGIYEVRQARWSWAPETYNYAATADETVNFVGTAIPVDIMPNQTLSYAGVIDSHGDYYPIDIPLLTTVNLTGDEYTFHGANYETPIAPVPVAALNLVGKEYFTVDNEDRYEMVGTGPATVYITTDAPIFMYHIGDFEWMVWEGPLDNEPFSFALGAGVFFEWKTGWIDVDTVPVELSSFTAQLTAQRFVELTWISATETNMLGYRVYRNETQEASTATLISELYDATNTSSTAVYHHTDRNVSAGNTYYYWLEAVDYNHSTMFGPQYVEVTAEPVAPEIIVQTAMKNAYPNPFKANTNTTIEVAVKAGETGTVTIYNVLGQVVQSYKVGAGINNLKWNGQDTRGSACGSGIYFYKLSTPSMNQTKKMVIVK
ncbi:MAG: T9SS type A sorting domain-containing protein [Candidatus Cloacimonetes bacterium]|nr:T9SS type A sorting domain-containing protein [Candidatus Cloacimonadota bacterium]